MSQAARRLDVPVPALASLPAAVRRYAETGAEPSAWRLAAVTIANQVPRWAYLSLALGASWAAYRRAVERKS